MDESLCDLSFYMCALTELQEIRIKFQANLREWFDIAHSLIAIASIGSLQLAEESISNNPVYSFSVPIKTTTGVNFASINKLQYSKMFEIYDGSIHFRRIYFFRLTIY